MKYKYSESAGYYGTGAWVCFYSSGPCKVLATEQEAIEYCAKFGGVK